MKTLIALILVASMENMALYAGSPMILKTNPGIFGATAVDTSDVTVYFNCDSASTTQTPTKGGTNQVTVGSGLSSVPGPVGNAIYMNQGGRTITISTNVANVNYVNWAAGRAGWYFVAGTGPTLGSMLWAQVTGNTMYMQVQSGTTLTANYENASCNVSTTSLTSGSTNYIEMAWDDSTSTLGAKLKVFVNGSLACSDNTAGGAPPTASFIKWAGIDGNYWDGNYDQIIVSTNPVKDLNALRDRTSF